MEEYFAPMGDSHKILDGRETRQLPWSFIGIGVALLALIFLVLGGWLWQRSRTFSVPPTPFTIHVRTSTELLATPWLSLLGDAWNQPLATSGVRIAGGTLAEPTWLIAPRWRRIPGWRQDESHGVYALFLPDAFSSQEARITQPLNQRSTLAKANEPFLAFGRIDTPSSTAWAVSSHGLFTDLPLVLRKTIDLTTPYASVYAVQDQPFDSLVLQSLAFHEQGLAPWRASLDVVRWSPTQSFEPWSLTLRPESTLSFLDTSSTLELLALRDGSFARTLRSSPSSTSSEVRVGDTLPLPPQICPLKNFQPFARFQDLPLPLTEDSILRTNIALGTQQDRFTLCLLVPPPVDN